MLSKNKKETFPKYRRIRSSEEFRLILNAYISSNKWFAVHVRKNNAGISRLGIIVSKRIVPRAINRNFVKRRIREKFRRDFPAKFAFDVVVRLRRPLDHRVAYDVQKALAQLLNDIQIKCDSF